MNIYWSTKGLHAETTLTSPLSVYFTCTLIVFRQTLLVINHHQAKFVSSTNRRRYVAAYENAKISFHLLNIKEGITRSTVRVWRAEGRVLERSSRGRLVNICCEVVENLVSMQYMFKIFFKNCKKFKKRLVLILSMIRQIDYKSFPE